jgi:hypothetical protein
VREGKVKRVRKREKKRVESVVLKEGKEGLE